MTSKLGQNQKSELNELKKMKVVQLHEQTKKIVFNPTPAPRIAHCGPKKSKMTPRSSQIQKSELKEQKKLKKIKVFQLHEQTTKQYLNPTLAQRSLNYLKTKLKELREIKVVQLYELYELFEHYPDYKNSPYGPKKVKK